jgi:outer membrane protein assembly factor BamE (lipoprotein component of BamABCDE complex)
MISKVASVLAAAGLLTVCATACSPVNSFQGFQAIEQSPNDIKAGADTRTTVTAKLGTPTAVSTFDKNTWFYLSQSSSKNAFYRPHVFRRNVVAIAFDKDTQEVSKVDVYTLKDGRIIAYNGRETPTRGREMTILEQLLGNLSTINALPPQDINPGSHPDEQH